MNVLMLTNVFAPQIGGVTRSVQQYCEELRRQGHQVLVVAPDYEETVDDEVGVIRVPAIPRFYLGVYSLPLPSLSVILPQIREFAPDIVHVHHPFLLGSTGQLIAADQNIPLVYTHHTRYSVYIETKTDIPRSIEEGIVELIVGFCELSDCVIAPSQGIQSMLRERGVSSRIEVIPTGVELERFQGARGSRFRQKYAIPDESFLVGHIGRLSPEKNTTFLTQSLAEFLKRRPDARIAVVGDGPSRTEMEETLRQAGVADRSVFAGFLEGEALVDAYAAFDVFAFASHSETQGMVLAEAMAAGTPVVAVQATGVQDFLRDGVNGRLVQSDNIEEFVAGLEAIADAPVEVREKLRKGALASAEEASQVKCTRKLLEVYHDLVGQPRRSSQSEWERLQQRWDASWQLWQLRTQAIAAAARETFSLSSEEESSGDSESSQATI